MVLGTVQKGEDLLKTVAEDFETLAKEADIINDPTLNALDDKYSYLLNAYSMTGSAKVKGVIEFLDTLIENKAKFIVFAHHYEVLDQIEDSLVKKKIQYIRIDGQIDTAKRYEAVRKFQTNPNIMVGVLSLTASSQGITLTAASTVVFAEMNWTPGIMVQAEDRVHRIGQIQSVNVYYCYGENTVDTMIYPRLKLKSEVFANVLDGKQTEFKIDNEEEDKQQTPGEAQEEENDKRKTMNKEQRLIEKAISYEEQRKFQQTNISDFFFSNGQNQSTVASENGIPDSQQIGTQLNNGQEIAEPDPDCEEHQWDRPPTPPLAGENINLAEDAAFKMDTEQEDWNEGSDSKWKTYQSIRNFKKKVWYEEKQIRQHIQRMGDIEESQQQEEQSIDFQAPPSIDPAERSRRQKESFKNAWKEYNVNYPPYRAPYRVRKELREMRMQKEQNNPFKHIYQNDQAKKFNDILDFRQAIANAEESFLQRLPQIDPQKYLEKFQESQSQLSTQRNAQNNYHLMIDGLLCESDVYTNDLDQVKLLSAKKRRSRKIDEEEAIYHPQQNSEDDDGQCMNEVKSIIQSQSRHYSQLSVMPFEDSQDFKLQPIVKEVKQVKKPRKSKKKAQVQENPEVLPCTQKSEENPDYLDVHKKAQQYYKKISEKTAPSPLHEAKKIFNKLQETSFDSVDEAALEQILSDSTSIPARPAKKKQSQLIEYERDWTTNNNEDECQPIEEDDDQATLRSKNIAGFKKYNQNSYQKGSYQHRDRTQMLQNDAAKTDAFEFFERNRNPAPPQQLMSSQHVENSDYLAFENHEATYVEPIKGNVGMPKPDYQKPTPKKNQSIYKFMKSKQK